MGRSTTTTGYTADQVKEALDAWARGSKPYQAAVQFLADTGTLDRPAPFEFIVIESDDYMWLNREAITGGLAEASNLSSGERATWALTLSLFAGDLERTFWDLDPRRQLAFRQAIQDHS
jgi:hypothetical protein